MTIDNKKYLFGWFLAHKPWFAPKHVFNGKSVGLHLREGPVEPLLIDRERERRKKQYMTGYEPLGVEIVRSTAALRYHHCRLR